MNPVIKRPLRPPRLGEAVFYWTGERLVPGRVVRIEPAPMAAADVQALERFRLWLPDHERFLECGRDDFALLPELRHLIPRMRRPFRPSPARPLGSC